MKNSNSKYKKIKFKVKKALKCTVETLLNFHQLNIIDLVPEMNVFKKAFL